MFSLPDVLHFFADVFSRLGAWCFPFLGIPPRSLSGSFLGHNSKTLRSRRASVPLNAIRHTFVSALATYFKWR